VVLAVPTLLACLAAAGIGGRSMRATCVRTAERV